MKIIANKKTEESTSGGLARILDQISDFLGDSSAQHEQEGHDYIIQRLGKFLDNNFYLLTNYTLPTLPVEIPMIIVGPPGVQVIYPRTQPGIFMAKDSGWYKMNDRKKEFEPAKENLVKRTSALAGGVQKFLRECGLNLEEIVPVMLFSDAGSHIDTSKPAIRIVPRDAIGKYAAGLMVASQSINNEDVSQISNLITRPSAAKTRIAQLQSQINQPPSEIRQPSQTYGEESIFPKPIDKPSGQASDDQPDWMVAIAEPEFEEGEEVSEESDQLNEFINRYSPAKIVAELGFTTGQWLLIAGIIALIAMTTFVALLLWFF